MKIFIQYDANENYSGEVIGSTPPDHPRQIEIDSEKLLASGIDYTALSFSNAEIALKDFK